MSRKIPCIFLLVLILTSLICCTANAKEITGQCGENVYYHLDTTTGICVISGSGDMQNDNYPGAFCSSPSSIRSIIIEEGITSIPHYAFHGCSNLINVTISNTVKSIDYIAFWGCSNLTSIELPDSITSIGGRLFQGCEKLTSVRMPNNLISLGTGVFLDCSSLSDISVSNLINPLFYSTSDTFSGCSSLTEVVIPDSVTTIGSNVFGNCSGLTHVVIPESVEKISFHAFGKCTQLSEITIPKFTTSIGERAFTECDNLKDVYYDCTFTRLEEIAENSSLLELPNVSFHCTEATSDFLIKTEDNQQIILGYIRENTSAWIPDHIASWNMAKSHKTLREVYLPSTLDSTCSFTLRVPNVCILDGVEETGQLTLIGLNSLYIPQSIKKFDNIQISSSAKPTIYCYEYSDAEIWALTKEYNVQYVTSPDDWNPMSLLDSLSWNLGTIYLDVGDAYTFEASQFTILPQDAIGLTPTIYEAEGLGIDGRSITALNPGNFKVTIRMGGKTASISVHVYSPTTSFIITGPDLVKTGQIISLSITNISGDSSKLFSWEINGDTVDETGTALSFTAPETAGFINVRAVAKSGVKKEITIWIASEISEPYVDSYARNAVVGSLIDIFVDIDGVTYRNDSRTFRSIEINETSQQYIQLYKESSILVKEAGRCVFGIIDFKGDTKNYLVVAHNPNGTLILPSNCQTIETEAFVGTTVEKVIIPIGCECIQDKAFANSNIKIIYIPSTLTNIGNSFLDNCQNITIICPQSSNIYEWAEHRGINVIPEHMVSSYNP